MIMQITCRSHLISIPLEKTYISTTHDAGIYRVLSFVLGQCTVVSGPSTNCQATVLANVNTYLSAENCYNGEGHYLDGVALLVVDDDNILASSRT
jgi:hypothetical protein